MFTNVAFSAHKALGGVAAAIVVAFGAATLDQGHLVGAPAGRIEVGEPVAVDGGTLAMLPEVTVTASRLVDAPARLAMLPEVTVKARRLSDAPEAVAQTIELPEVVVLGRRVATLVANASQASKVGAATTALLK